MLFLKIQTSAVNTNAFLVLLRSWNMIMFYYPLIYRNRLFPEMSTAVGSHSGSSPLSLMSCVRESSPSQDLGSDTENEKTGKCTIPYYQITHSARATLPTSISMPLCQH